jgi:curved DNA-binding protein CbpA
MSRTRFDRDYYAVMGLPPEATEDEVRRAYRRLALQWHPDRNRGDAGAADRFKEISEAYAVLIDPVKRREYDRARQLGATGEFHHTREDIFRDLFSDPRASAVFDELAREFERLGMRVDARHFRQTLFGGRTVVTGHVVVITPFTLVPALFRLARAAARGARAARPVEAPSTRAVPPAPARFLGRLGRWLLGLPAGGGATPPEDVVLPLRLTRAEADRGGKKRVMLNHGGGLDELLVTVPAGIRAGARLRLRGKGRPGPGGARGDVYLAVEIAERG